jgi:IMP cyclohydrolase
MQVTDMAVANFERHLKQNAYPGRGLVVGVSSTHAAWLMIYWIMGRSVHSQNRRFVAEAGVLRTEPVDASRVEDPGLIIYDAMLEWPPIYLVGNGAQVRGIYDTLQAGGSFDAALAAWEREPDAPHYTPRISAMLDLGQPPGSLTLSLLKANAANPNHTDRFTYRPANPPAGFGVGLTTYGGDGHPLPSFTGEPLLLPCTGDLDEVLGVYWHALDANNRVSLAVKRIPQHGGASEMVVRNRFGTNPQCHPEAGENPS